MQLLIAGEKNNIIAAASDLAIKEGAVVTFVTTIKEVLQHARQGKGSDIILVDTKFDILSLKSKLLAEKICVPIIAYGIDISPNEAVKSIKSGAKEFLHLPADQAIISTIFSKLSKNKKDFLFSSDAMQKIISVVDKIQHSDAHIFINGESGTGKEVLAHYIHNKSSRSNKPFIRVNCAAIPDNLLESELFGHEKGAFTGAIGRRIGKFEESSGGTLLLDEITEMDIRLQAKLLRAVQEKEIDRIGGNRPIKVNLKIIATSNRDIHSEIRKGNFREDLFFRLNIINFYLPSLSKRKSDIEILTQHFITKYCDSNKVKPKTISKEALDSIYSYSWPGNIRELENTIHRAVLLSNNEEIELSDLQFNNSHHHGKEETQHEDKLVIDTLNYCFNNSNAKAEILTIAINALKDRLKSISN